MHAYFLRKNCSVNDIDEGRRFLPAFLLASGLKVTRPSSTDLRRPSRSSSFELRCQKLRNLNLDLEDGLAGEVFEPVVTGDGDVMEEAPDDDVVDELPALPPELAVVTGILNKFKNHLLSLLSLHLSKNTKNQRVISVLIFNEIQTSARRIRHADYSDVWAKGIFFCKHLFMSLFKSWSRHVS